MLFYLCFIFIFPCLDVGGGMRALCHEGMGQVHTRGPMATSTSENSRTTSRTVRVCRVRVVTNCDGWTRMCALLVGSFYVARWFCGVCLVLTSGVCGMRALCHDGMGQVHSRGPMAPSTSENGRTISVTVRVCRVRVVTNCDGWTRMSDHLMMPFFLSFCAFLFMFYFYFSVS